MTPLYQNMAIFPKKSLEVYLQNVQIQRNKFYFLLCFRLRKLYYIFVPNPQKQIYMAATITTLAHEFGVDRRTLLKIIIPIAHKLRYKEQNRIILTMHEENCIRQFIGMDKNQGVLNISGQ